MDIGFYTLSNIKDSDKHRILRRAQAEIESVTAQLRPIIEDVKARGDAALIDYALRFDKAQLAYIKVPATAINQAGSNLDPHLKAALDHCITNVKRFHAAQMERVDKPWMIEIEAGVFAGEKITPIHSVGLYVPRGKGCFPSSVYMMGVPAVLAGVSQIALITPPTPEGIADEAVLYAAKQSGIKDVYLSGGAQAIAALAYGTETIPKVAKVVGPGSPYVQAAKQLLFNEIDPGMPASSSEAIILADHSANPHNTCLDMLNEAEHGADSGVLLVTHDKILAEFARDNLPSYIAALPEPQRGFCTHGFSAAGYGGVILTESIEESIAFTNLYAPEHLHIKTERPEDTAQHIQHAGEILLGEYTASSLGNYGIGVNHTLPTGGKAYSYSCTSVWDFLKRTSMARVDKQGFEALKESVTILTDYEGFPAHGNVLRQRKII